MNKTTKTRVLWIALPLVVVLGVGAAAAGYKHHGGHHSPERMVQRISDRLELTDEQRQKLDAVKEALVSSRQEMRQERAETISRLIDEVKKPALDEEVMMELIDERKTRLEKILLRIIEPMIAFHSSLNEQQRQKIVNLLETMRDWGWGRSRWKHG
jgi:Spy/CpxP family protein refolding chaperone